MKKLKEQLEAKNTETSDVLNSELKSLQEQIDSVTKQRDSLQIEVEKSTAKRGEYFSNNMIWPVSTNLV